MAVVERNYYGVTIANDGSSCHLDLSGKTAITLTYLKTDHDKRRKGYAKAILAEAKEIATEQGKILRLWAGPWDDRPMNKQQLTDFYERIGFDVSDPYWLEWTPKS